MKLLQRQIGEHCKRWRYNHNITQREVAKACGVNRITVYRFEEGINFSKKLFKWYLDHNAVDFKTSFN